MSTSHIELERLGAEIVSLKVTSIFMLASFVCNISRLRSSPCRCFLALLWSSTGCKIDFIFLKHYILCYRHGLKGLLVTKTDFQKWIQKFTKEDDAEKDDVDNNDAE